MDEEYNGYKLASINAEHLHLGMTFAIGVIGPTLLEYIKSGKYIVQVDNRKALDMVDMLMMMIRNAVTEEGKTDDDMKLRALAIMVLVAMQQKSAADGFDLEFSTVEKK